MVDSAGDVTVDSGGIDTVAISAPLASFTMAPEIENAVIWAVPAVPGERIRVTGTMLSNRIDGGAGDDALDGNGGDDLLIGGDGNDILYGGSGDDVLLPGLGYDQMYLGSGRDVVIYQSLLEMDGDSIEHFNPTCRIDLSAIDASPHGAGDQAFIFLGAGAFTGREGELRVEGSPMSVNSRVWIDYNGDMLADVSFAVVGNMPTEANFVL